jgi:hypothetical protein
MVPTELQPSFKSHHRLLIPGSRNYTSLSATSLPARDVFPRRKHELHENRENIFAFPCCLFRHLQMAFDLH